MNDNFYLQHDGCGGSIALRKKGANGQESRTRLLAAAASEFARLGYHETKISAIVSKAGLTQPSFYLYFQSKEAVFAELTDLFKSEVKELIKESEQEAEKRGESGMDPVLSFLTRLFSLLAHNPDLTRIGFFLSEEAAAVKEELAAMIERCLLSTQRNREADARVNVSVAADCIVGAVERLTLRQLLPGKFSSDDLAREIAHLYRNGVGNRLLIGPNN